MTIKRIGLIGAGNIAGTHAAAIRALRGLELTAVFDPVAARAEAMARTWKIGKTYAAAEAMIADKAVDAVHVLVPPPLHRSVAEPLLRAGLHVFLEKPMAQNGAECAALQRAAAEGGARLRINHNFVHHPCHIAAKRMLARNEIGTLRHVECRFNVPLRQLGARQLGHWMFNTPGNLLLEQAVHPLSQIDDLVGPVVELAVLPAPPLQLSDGQEVHRTWLVSLRCERGTAQLYLSLGETYPSWGATLIGDDGAISIDYLNNRVAHESSGRYPDFADSLRNGTMMALAWQGQALVNAANYVASTAKLRPRTDVFFQSMKGSIEAFYRDLETASGDLDGANGRRMVELCERIVAAGKLPDRLAKPTRAKTSDGGQHDVLVIGGTGFIGSQVVTRLLASGHRVAILARNVANLPALFDDERVSLFRGDARSAADVTSAIGKAGFVINLAHGGGGGSWPEIRDNLVGAATNVAECCLKGGVRRLVFVSSIASLYLGDSSETVTTHTPPDPLSEQRADYARAKAMAERALLDLHGTRSLPVCILRPGVVIGEGGSPFHSGIGFYNRDRHCMGWNRGANPLPLVLVEEVAEATVNALAAPGIVGSCYNLVGEVRLSASEYTHELAAATGRPLRYHGQSVIKLYAIECLKAVIKRATGRRDPWPSLRDLRSRGLVATFDCSDVVRDLGWHPVTDRAEFLRRGFQVHAAKR